MRIYRKLSPFELHKLEAHLLRLDLNDRAMRFSAAVNESVIKRHSRDAGSLEAVVIGCFVDGTLRGVAELFIDRDDDRRCELAVTVEKAFQGIGIGSELFRRAVQVAVNRSLTVLHMLCMLENRRMQRIAMRAGCTISVEADQARAEIALPQPTAVTFLDEAMRDGLGRFSAAMARYAWL